MDEVERLIHVFSSYGVTASTDSKLNVLMNLGRLHDRRVVFFLVQLLEDPGEPAEVRMRALKRLRNGPLTADDRVTVAGALCQHLSRHGGTIVVESRSELAQPQPYAYHWRYPRDEKYPS
jgi:hypothetical protein